MKQKKTIRLYQFSVDSISVMQLEMAKPKFVQPMFNLHQFIKYTEIYLSN